MSARGGYNPGEFCWVDFVAHDAAAAEMFYCELFGGTRTFRWPTPMQQSPRPKPSAQKIEVPPTDIPPGRFAVITDPQGGVFHVIKLNNPE